MHIYAGLWNSKWVVCSDCNINNLKLTVGRNLSKFGWLAAIGSWTQFLEMAGMP